MPDSRLKASILLTSLALLAVVVLGAFRGSDAVAADLRSTAEARLAEAGLDGVSVDFAGREAELSGGSRADRTDARAIVDGLRGVRRTTVAPGPGDQPAPRPTLDARAARLTLVRTSSGARIAGIVPDADARARIRAAAAAAFGTVRGDLAVDREATGAAWVGAVADVFDEVVAVKRLSLRIDGAGTVSIGGVVESAVGRTVAKDRVRAALPDLEVEDRVRVDAGGLTAADARVVNGTSAVFVQGSSLLTYVDQQALYAVAQVLLRNPRLRIEAVGHAGPADPTKGEVLSRQRVRAVEAFLTAQGVPDRQVSTRSLGSDPSSTADPAAEQYRRVDLVIERS